MLHDPIRRRPLRRGVLAAVALALVLVPLSAAGGFTGRNGAIVVVSGTDVILDSGSGSHTVLVSDAAGSGASLSPDGSKLAYTDATGVAIVCVTSTCSAVHVTGGSEPSWAPDGTTNADKIAYVTAAGQLRTVSADGTGDTPVTSGIVAADPAWSPDGTKIAFAKKRGATTDYEIWVLTVGGTEAQVTSASGVQDRQPTWSPDGDTIAFQSDRTGQDQIYEVASSGGLLTQVTNDGSADTDPVWSPDPDTPLLAFVQGGTDVVTMPAGGGSETTYDTTSLTTPETADWQTLVPLAGSTAPTVTSGDNPAQGTTISATTGDWTGAQDFTYQYERCDANGAGCTAFGTAQSSPSYTLGSADVGMRLKVLVTAENTAGSSAPQTSSNMTPVVIGPGPTNLTLPSISISLSADAPTVGSFVFATAGSWTGSRNTYAYQWKKCEVVSRSCFDLPGATSSSLSVTASLYGYQLRVMVTATNADGARSVNSDATGTVTADPPLDRISPPISGLNQVGQRLTIGVGTWSGTLPIAYTYSWRRCDPQGDLPTCVAIPGATSSSYVLTDADAGSAIRGYVTATNVAGAVTAFSNHTFPVVGTPGVPPPSPIPANAVAPAVAGTAAVGSTLTGDRGIWTGKGPLRYAYAWQRCDAVGMDCHAVRGARKAIYRIGAADLGSTLRLSVSASNPSGAATATSAVTETVALARPVPKPRHLIGNGKANYLAGGGGDDVVLGRAGNDTILGGAGDDRLDGGPGNDVIDGGPGGDTIDGGPGSDTIRAADGERDVIDCGSGHDHATVDAVDKTIGCELITVAPTAATASPQR